MQYIHEQNKHRNAAVKRNETRRPWAYGVCKQRRDEAIKPRRPPKRYRRSRTMQRTHAQQTTKRRTNGRTTHNCRHTHVAIQPRSCAEDTTRREIADTRQGARCFHSKTTAPCGVAEHLLDGTRPTRLRQAALITLRSALRRRVPSSQRHAARTTTTPAGCRERTGGRTARARHKAADQRQRQRRVALRSPPHILLRTSPPPKSSRKRGERGKPQSSRRERSPGSSPHKPLPLPKKLRLSFAHSQQAATTFPYPSGPRRPKTMTQAGTK